MPCSKARVCRVVASDDAAPFVAKGGNVFAKHVLSVDPEIRAGEEVLVVDSQDRLLATGTAVLAPEEMLQIKRGLAVQPERLQSTDRAAFDSLSLSFCIYFAHTRKPKA